MRQKKWLVLALMLGLTGCGTGADTTETVVETESSEEIETTETEESEEAEAQGPEINLISLTEGENEFTDAVRSYYGDSDTLEAGNTFAYYETDLDVDGNQEAIVLYGYEDDIQTDEEGKPYLWYSSQAWFVGEDMKVETLFSYTNSTSEYFIDQQYEHIGDKAYFILNGCQGIDSIGLALTMEKGELTKAAPDAWDRGQKVIQGDELIWYMDFYGRSFTIDKELTIKNWDRTGRVYVPYKFYMEDGFFKLYQAHELTREEVEDMANLEPLSYEKDAVAIQYLLRDNGELEINYVLEQGDTYDFAADVYSIPENGKKWERQNQVFGYFTDTADVFGDHWKFFKQKYGEPYVFHRYTEEELKAMTPPQLFEAFTAGEIEAEATSEDGEIYHYDTLAMDFDDIDVNDGASIGDPIDIDNDGELEYVITNAMYGATYYDCKNGKVVEIAGGEGTAAYCSSVNYRGVNWVIHSDTTHGGRCYYHFDRYKGDLTIEESFELYWLEEEDGAKRYYYNEEEISEAEYQRVYDEIFK